MINSIILDNLITEFNKLEGFYINPEQSRSNIKWVLFAIEREINDPERKEQSFDKQALDLIEKIKENLYSSNI